MSLTRRIASARLETGKVSLRPVAPGDAKEAYELLHGQHGILRWLLWRGPESVSELERSFAPWSEQPADCPDYVFAIVERESGRFCGTTGLRFGGQPGSADIGYWVSEALWGRGLGSDAIQLCCSFAFRQLEVPAINAWAFVGNEGSKKVLERAGFTLMRTVLQKVESDGQAYDQWNFVVLREEWLARNVHWSPELEEIEFQDSSSS